MTKIEELAESAARVKLRMSRYDEAGLPDDNPIRAHDNGLYTERLALLKEALAAGECPFPMDELIARALAAGAESLTEDEAMSAVSAAVLLEAMSDT